MFGFRPKKISYGQNLSKINVHERECPEGEAATYFQKLYVVLRCTGSGTLAAVRPSRHTHSVDTNRGISSLSTCSDFFQSKNKNYAKIHVLFDKLQYFSLTFRMVRAAGDDLDIKKGHE